MNFIDMLRILSKFDPDKCRFYVLGDGEEWEHERIEFKTGANISIKHADNYHLLPIVWKWIEENRLQWQIRQTDKSWYAASVNGGNSWESGPTPWYALLKAYLMATHPNYKKDLG